MLALPVLVCPPLPKLVPAPVVHFLTERAVWRLRSAPAMSDKKGMPRVRCSLHLTVRIASAWELARWPARQKNAPHAHLVSTMKCPPLVGASVRSVLTRKGCVQVPASAWMPRCGAMVWSTVQRTNWIVLCFHKHHPLLNNHRQHPSSQKGFHLMEHFARNQ